MKKRRVVNAPNTEELVWRVRARLGRLLEKLEEDDPSGRATARRWPRRREAREE